MSAKTIDAEFVYVLGFEGEKVQVAPLCMEKTVELPWAQSGLGSLPGSTLVATRCMSMLLKACTFQAAFHSLKDVSCCVCKH
jgi:hypothetical protein